MSNTNTTPKPTPSNLPAALARAQRTKPEPSLASIGIDTFEPAGPTGPVGIPGDAGGIAQRVPAPAPNTPSLGPTGAAGTPGVVGVNADPALYVYIATFAIKKGAAHSNVKIEVPCTGGPHGDKAAAWAEVRRQFPNVAKNNIVRTSEKISPRAGTGSQSIRLTDGMTIRQLFPDKSEFEATRLVGRISFESEPHDVILRHIRAKSVFSLTLKPLKGPATINFSEQVTTTRLASELPVIITQLLGDAGKNLVLYFVKV